MPFRREESSAVGRRGGQAGAGRNTTAHAIGFTGKLAESLRGKTI
jgi:hypothetical protein